MNRMAMSYSTKIGCYARKISVAKEQIRGQIYHIATVRLADDRAGNRAARGPSGSLEPLILLAFQHFLWYNGTSK